MTDSTLVKLIAMISGLLVLTLIAALSAAHGFRLAEVLATMALGACTVCYGLQMTPQRLLAIGTSVISWVLGVCAFGYYLVGR